MTAVGRASDTLKGPNLRRLHTGVVEPDQIDQLGHMNVRYYGVRAMAASRALARELELSRGANAKLAFVDLFTRHYREQLEGAPLEVWGGVLEAAGTGVRFYQELINAANGELAAAFVHKLQLQDPETRNPLAFAPEVLEDCSAAVIEWPEHGHPRSMELDRTPAAITLEEARLRHLEDRKPRVIQPEECNDEGFFKSSKYWDLCWGGEPADESEDDNDWIRTDANGRRYGWAIMESRGSLFRLPRIGARIQSFFALVNITRKARHEKFWVFDLDTNDLLCTAQIVNVAFDLAARRAIEIPAEHRAELEQQFHPDLL